MSAEAWLEAHCQRCGYQMIGGWCSRCDLDALIVEPEERYPESAEEATA